MGIALLFMECMKADDANTTNLPKVVCYTRTGIAPKLGNALHLGYSEDGKSYIALNNDACVMALRKVNDESGLTEKERIQGVMKTLDAPYIFRMKEGGFGIVALRTDQKGQPDISACGAFLFIRTQDLVHYEPERLCKLPFNGMLEEITCEYDAASGKYCIKWTSNKKVFQCYTTNFTDFSAANPTLKINKKTEYIVQNWHNFHNARFGNSLALTKEEGEYLKNKLGRVVHTANLPLEISLPVSDSIVSEVKKARVTLLYNDGSHADKRVIWNKDDLNHLASAMPGTYTIRGEIFQYPFNYPVLISNRADPNILYYEGKYYMVGTCEVQWNHISIRCSETLDGLSDADKSRWRESVLIQGEKEHWAPELHIIGSHLYLLLAIHKEDGIQAYMMRLKKEGNPMCPKDWDAPVRVVKPDGTPLRRNGDTDGITLDMTYFEDNGKSYVCWSDRKVFYVNGEKVDPGPVLCIATVNPHTPWSLTSEPSVIGSEAYSWTFCRKPLQLAEGPFVLESKDNKIYMFYSGGGVTGGNYEVGMLTAHKRSDLLDAKNWYNSPRPWMNNGSSVSQVGPGHNSFVKDEYGDLYNVYHSGHVPRHTAICPVHFRFDGSPVIDMAPWEEINPNLKQVKMQVRILPEP